jgi:nicotinamidase-related amidase
MADERQIAPVPRSLAELLAPPHTALLIWDMQNGMGGHAFNLGALVPRLQSLIAAARDVGVFVMWSRHVMPPLEISPAPVLRDFMRRQGVSDPRQLKPFMQAGTSDVELISGLEPSSTDLVFEKSTRSAFVGTAIELVLRVRNIRSVVIAGVQTDQGVEVTARHAFALGLFPVVAEDAVGSRTSQAHELGLTFLRQTQTDVVPVDEIIAAWRDAT